MAKYRTAHREEMKAYQRDWYLKNREHTLRRKARWRKENPQSLALYERRHNLKSKYGMSLEDYDTMVERQNGLCLLCKERHKLVVDHDHQTDQVRGLLCANCNLLLGHARDSVPILLAAIEYLETCNKIGQKEDQ